MRAKLEDAFQTCQSYSASGLRRMQDRGELNAEADVALATGVVAALQGGLILAQAARSEKPLRAALDLAVGRVALAADMARPADSQSGRPRPPSPTRVMSDGRGQRSSDDC
jgi:TetR/AcrR family transcriptional repressor of nem operon